MATPVTDENVKFDGSLTPSIVVENITQGFQKADFNGAALGANPTGLANDATVFTATVLVNDLPFASAGAENAIAITGSTAQTFTTLVAQLNADLTGATATIEPDGNIKIESDATGVPITNSSILISDGDLFSSLTGFDGFEAPHGVGTDLFVVSQLPSQLDLDRFCTLINTYGGSLPLSPSAGLQTVNVGGAIIGATATGLANDATVYVMDVVVDGVVNPVSIIGSAAQTYTNLVTEINADLTGATSSVSTGDLVITSSATPTFVGDDSSINIVDGVDSNTSSTLPLLRSLTDFVGLQDPISGVFNFRDALQKNTIHARGALDASFDVVYGGVERFAGLKPAEVFAGSVPNTLTYFDGAIFRLLFDDSAA